MRRDPARCALTCVLLCVALLWPGAAAARAADRTVDAYRQAVTPVVSQPTGETRHRLEATLAYESLRPEANYGTRKELTLDYYVTQRPGFTWYAETISFWRLEGAGMQAGGGAYYDWAPRLYTYSACSFGSRADFLPQVRIDHEFNFKCGRTGAVVLTAAGTYITYHIPYEDITLAGAGTYYGAGWLCGYRLSRNKSEPGSVISTSQQFTGAIGAEGRQWTYLTVTVGATAYTATTVFPSQVVSNDVVTVDLKHRHWVGARWGLTGEAQCLSMADGYDDYRVGMGTFFLF